MNNTLKNHYHIISRMNKLVKYNVDFTLTNTTLKIHVKGTSNLTITDLNIVSVSYVDGQLDCIEETLAESKGYEYHVYSVWEYLGEPDEEHYVGSYRTKEAAQKEANAISSKYKYRYGEVRRETNNYN